MIDNERGGTRRDGAPARLGHRRIALLVADTDWTSDAGRLRATARRTRRRASAVDERLILPIAFHAPDAEQRIDALLTERAPTAIFAANNLLAEHAWQVLRRRQLKLPRDVSLVAFDDVPWMTMVEPRITVGRPADPSRWDGGRRDCCFDAPRIRTGRPRSSASSRR